MESGSVAVGPSKPKMLSDLFQAVRVRREVDLRVNEGEKIERRKDKPINKIGGANIGVARLHALEELGLVASVVNQLRVAEQRKCLQK